MVNPADCRGEPAAAGDGFKVVECGATITGPKVGFRVVAWRKQCRRKIRIPVDQAGARCHLHRDRSTGRVSGRG